MNPATDAPELAPPLVNRLAPVRTPVIVTVPEAAAPRPWYAAPVVLVALAVLGVGLRAVPLFGDRNLWIDEAMLALNLVNRSASELLKPLDWNQGAPAGFLVAAKASVEVFGPTAFGLRFVPFLAAALGMIAFAWLAAQVLPRGTATFAVLLFAVSPFLISYAAECKQYSSDAAITVGLLAVSVGLLHGKGGARRWAGLSVAGAVAVWFSHPSVFVLGGIGTALLIHALVERDRTRFLAAAGGGGPGASPTPGRVPAPRARAPPRPGAPAGARPRPPTPRGPPLAGAGARGTGASGRRTGTCGRRTRAGPAPRAT